MATNYAELPYLELLEKVLNEGRWKDDRTGVGTWSLFGRQMRFDLRAGFPATTTKKLQWKSVVAELLWFLSGSTNAFELRDKHGVNIWTPWADEDGELGPIYAKQWRAFHNGFDFMEDEITHDQIAALIEGLLNNPLSRRHIVTAWNPTEVEMAALPPCHVLFQFVCEPLTIEERYPPKDTVFIHNTDIWNHEYADEIGRPRYRLSCHLYQRSADMFLGVPFNIASYALLTHMVAHVVGMVPGEFVWTGGECHIYTNHRDQVQQQLSRSTYPAPTLRLNPTVRSVDDLGPDDIQLIDYQHHPAIKAPIAV